ncbi:hypothetical protein [Sedimenticola hydrogenitrophicus]|uniref:hypothetical protein n=1 Tax=Sedimenticola hydrogenitrophicus TaxID=2967975 RepID=UPI0021A6C2CD|nr:hypothetical protein [Sedimenticola hydrogenitrophicus]
MPLHDELVLVRTAAGRQELEQRSRTLSLSLRKLLILTDGNNRVGDLRRLMGSENGLDRDLCELICRGLVVTLLAESPPVCDFPPHQHLAANLAIAYLNGHAKPLFGIIAGMAESGAERAEAIGRIERLVCLTIDEQAAMELAQCLRLVPPDGQAIG